MLRGGTTRPAAPEVGKNRKADEGPEHEEGEKNLGAVVAVGVGDEKVTRQWRTRSLRGTENQGEACPRTTNREVKGRRSPARDIQ